MSRQSVFIDRKRLVVSDDKDYWLSWRAQPIRLRATAHLLDEAAYLAQFDLCTCLVATAYDTSRLRAPNNRLIYQCAGTAWLYRGFAQPKVLRKHIGAEKDHTVFEGECVGQILGMELIRREVGVRTASLGTDNQAGMAALTQPGPGTARYLVDQVMQGIQRIKGRNPNIHMQIYWTPAHKGIPGNERADKEAKKAAEGKTTVGLALPFLAGALPVSKAAIRRRQKKEIRKRADEVFKKSPRFERMKAIDPSLPSRKFHQLTKGLPRKHAALLFQMRANHCPLNQYLHRFKKIESPKCPGCREKDETVKHFLLECPAYQQQRTRLHEIVRPGPDALGTLLSDPKATKALFMFVTETRRFEEALGDMYLHTERRREPRTQAT